MADRAQHTLRGRRKRGLLIVAVLVGVDILATIAWGNYRWHQGFAAGADTAMCVIAHQVDGAEAAMREPYCQNISGKTVPYFPDNLRPQGPPAETEARP